MSAIFNPSPAQAEAPPRLDPAPARPPSRAKWWWVAVAVVLAASGLAYLAFRGKTQKLAVETSARTARIVTGSLDRVLRISGTTANCAPLSEAHGLARVGSPLALRLGVP